MVSWNSMADQKQTLYRILRIFSWLIQLYTSAFCQSVVCNIQRIDLCVYVTYTSFQPHGLLLNYNNNQCCKNLMLLYHCMFKKPTHFHIIMYSYKCNMSANPPPLSQLPPKQNFLDETLTTYSQLHIIHSQHNIHQCPVHQGACSILWLLETDLKAAQKCCHVHVYQNIYENIPIIVGSLTFRGTSCWLSSNLHVLSA